MKPYYQDEFVTIFHAEYRRILQRGEIDPFAVDVLVTDPPYGIAYKSNSPRRDLEASIEGDQDTSLRDDVLHWWREQPPYGERPALVFGTWRAPRPEGTRARLIWDTRGALGMGDLSLPWKPSDQEIYVLGKGFSGHRGSNVLSFAPVQSMARNGRVHPHEKPVDLMRSLLMKCPPGTILDPFCGSGSTLRAAKDLGRESIGIETTLKYCYIAARRCSQDNLFQVAS